MASSRAAVPLGEHGAAATFGPLSQDCCWPLLRQYGTHSLAYATMQPGMAYFGAPGVGYIACRRRLGQWVALGDPVCRTEHRSQLLDAFLAARPRTLFMQVGRGAARELAARGFRNTPVGVENDVDTATFDLQGRRKRDLRHYRNRAQAAGVRVREVADTPAMRRALEPVSLAWLPSKSWWQHELEFLARPYCTLPEEDVRIFVGEIDGAPAGFVILDPIYEAGQAAGYTVSILRHYPDAPEGTCDYINVCLIEQLRAEGIERVSLGVSPFYRMEAYAAEEGRGALPVFLVFRALYRYGGPIYHFRGLSFHKSRYRAQEHPVYAAAPGPFGLLPLYASARACRML